MSLCLDAGRVELAEPAWTQGQLCCFCRGIPGIAWDLLSSTYSCGRACGRPSSMGAEVGVSSQSFARTMEYFCLDYIGTQECCGCGCRAFLPPALVRACFSTLYSQGCTSFCFLMTVQLHWTSHRGRCCRACLLWWLATLFMEVFWLSFNLTHSFLSCLSS